MKKAKPSKRGPKSKLNGFEENIAYLIGQPQTVPKTIRRTTKTKRSHRKVLAKGKLFSNFDDLFGLMNEIVDEESDLKSLFADVESENPRESADMEKALKFLVDQLGFMV
ncbi:MAG TPA: hypothetical protein ENI23_00715 [bacterium]|nr:hypothetical protein [bacterium]